MIKSIEGLMKSEAYVQYATRINIFKQDKKDLKSLKDEVLLDSRINKYLNDITDFNGMSVTNHKNPELPIHKLIFLLDIGLDREITQIDSAIKQILSNKGEDGMYRCVTNIPKHFGGTGKDALTWCLCDAPLMLYALVNGGVSFDNHIKQGIDYIYKLHRDNGFPCAASNELENFRGPGRKEDCCPYATLITLKLFSEITDYKNSTIAEKTVMALLDLWENSREKHPYIFYMGTDFRKLKAPTIWYDIVSVADCLSRFECAKKDKRFHEMLDIIESKADSNHYFTPESIYLKCKEWDFGQKKQPSSWLTYICLGILERSGRISFGL